MSYRLRFFLNLSILLAIVLLAGLSSLSGRFDRFIYDQLAQCCQADRVHNHAVVLVDIDASTLQALEAWPLSRFVHANMLDWLSRVDASSVTYNIAFITPDSSANSADDALVAAMQSHQRLVLPLLAENGRELLPLARPTMSGVTYAHADLAEDNDGIVRRHYLHAGIALPRWPSLALASVQRYAPAKNLYYAGVRSPYQHIGFAQRWSRDFEMLLPLGIQPFMRDIRRVSFDQVIKGQVEPALFKNKAVFVGLKNAKIEPFLQTASGQYISATELQAYLFSALEQRKTLTPVLPLWSLVVAIGLSALLCLVCFGGLTKALQGILSCACVVTLCLPFLLYYLGFWFSVLPLLVALFGTFVLALCSRIFFSRRGRLQVD